LSDSKKFFKKMTEFSSENSVIELPGICFVILHIADCRNDFSNTL